MDNIVLYLIVGLVASSVSVVALCFGAKLIRLRRENTELFIPILGTVVFALVFQMGLDIVNSLVMNFFIDFAAALAVSQIIYILCRKIGSKSGAVKRFWVFIGLAALASLGSFAAVYFAKNINESIIMLDLFFGCLLGFVLMLFNVVFYKITKEISFTIRNKRR